MHGVCGGFVQLFDGYTHLPGLCGRYGQFSDRSERVQRLCAGHVFGSNRFGQLHDLRTVRTCIVIRVVSAARSHAVHFRACLLTARVMRVWLAVDSGSFQNLFGRTLCTLCASGSFVGSPGQGACLPCPAGTFFNETGATVCTDCPRGKSQSANGQSACVDCATGTHIPTSGQSSCVTCT